MMKRGSTFGELAILFLIPRNPSCLRHQKMVGVIDIPGPILASHIISVALCCFAVSEFKCERTYETYLYKISCEPWELRRFRPYDYSVDFSGSVGLSKRAPVIFWFSHILRHLELELSERHLRHLEALRDLEHSEATEELSHLPEISAFFYSLSNSRVSNLRRATIVCTTEASVWVLDRCLAEAQKSTSQHQPMFPENVISQSRVSLMTNIHRKCATKSSN